MTGSRIYSTWKNIKHRSKNPEDHRYNTDKHLVIPTCKEWEDSFEVFYTWAMANGYTDNLTIDRIDGSKGYFPENCRWVTRKQQSNNIATNRIITIDGVSHTMSEWSDISGISRHNIEKRLKMKWDEKKAVFTPVNTAFSNKSKKLNSSVV